MASQIKLYTTGNMVDAVVTAATSEAVGFPRGCIADNNLDTYWKPTSTADQTIDIDLGSAKAVNCHVAFIKNYLTLSSISVSVYYSDNGSTYTYYVGALGAWAGKTAGPIRIKEFTEVTHRYWRFVLGTPNEIVKVAGIWLGRTFTIAQGNQFPQNDREGFKNSIYESAAGRRFTFGLAKRRAENIERVYIFPSATNFGYLRDAIRDSFGGRLPIIVNEGANDYDGKVCYIEGDFAENQFSYLAYNPTLSLYVPPYIEDGAVY